MVYLRGSWPQTAHNLSRTALPLTRPVVQYRRAACNRGIWGASLLLLRYGVGEFEICVRATLVDLTTEILDVCQHQHSRSHSATAVCGGWG
jgi:hypothetical protein